MSYYSIRSGIKKKYQRLKADGDIRTKFNGKAESVMRDDMLDKSNLE